MPKPTQNEVNAIIEILSDIQECEAVAITLGKKKIIISCVNKDDSGPKTEERCRVRSHNSTPEPIE